MRYEGEREVKVDLFLVWMIGVDVDLLVWEWNLGLDFS